MQCRRPSGLFGNVFEYGNNAPEAAKYVGNQFLCGLVNYYALTGDMRVLNAAKEAADHSLNLGDVFFDTIRAEGAHKIDAWMSEGFAELYRETRDEKYLDAVRRIAKECVGTTDGAHAHGYLTTLRGFQRAAIYSGDMALADIAKAKRQDILDNGFVLANGDVSECLPRSHRNEGCAIADWVMLNLYHGYIYDDDEAYAIAEHALWNSLYFNQFVTGGFGHRSFAKRGYLTYIEEAWWCCTQTAGLCFAEIARHTATVKGGKLKLNFLIPGRYTLPGDVTVSVTTGYPTKAYTVVEVSGTKEEIDVRIPSFIKQVSIKRVETDFGYKLFIDGKMGHYTEAQEDGYVLKYGPMIIAPMIYNWRINTNLPENNTVPVGYVRESMPDSTYQLMLDQPDENGFIPLQHDPLPYWSVFEEGEYAGISGGEMASAHVNVRFANGTVTDMYFQPLCSATSNLSLSDVPVVFDIG